MNTTQTNGNLARLRICIDGAVQGVGFRPFVYRLARGLDLKGWVENSPQGVTIEVEGPRTRLRDFRRRVVAERPPLAEIRSCRARPVALRRSSTFEIRRSAADGEKTAIVLPDIATCADCLRDISDPANRRYRYPFTNCTNCGPRFSIIESLPYDRPRTSMRLFEMCDDCRREYEDPADRRFHAQPNACPACGPHLELWEPTGRVVGSCEEALIAAADAVRRGRILALKGLGGFQLIADARRGDVVAELRRRKHREKKPLALMVPSIAGAGALCVLDRGTIRALRSPQAPIVLAPRRADAHQQIAENVAPRSPRLGVMLPYTPLHHLLMRELGFPVVATSGNRSEEPICIDPEEALRRLDGIADLFLTHNRPIVRHVDDSVVQIVCGEPMVLRRARGFAPAPVEATTAREAILAVGPHQKNTVALAARGNIFVSQHVGDLTTPQATDAFEQAARDLPALYEASPRLVACDLHPDYYSSRRAAEWSARPQRVQHHHAHIAACLAEHQRNELALGVAWDGTGLGPDGTIWGGEFLRGDLCAFERVAHLDGFPLPGGELAAREPRRSALGVLFATFGEAIFERHDWPPVAAFRAPERRVLRTALQRGVNCPLTSAAGRLFDAVASILDIRQRVRYEGQAAIELEYAAAESDDDNAYPFELPPSRPQRIDWRAMIRVLLADRERGEPPGVIARRFHNTLVEMIVAIAQRFGETPVVLSGGCFQNVLLLSSAIERLKRIGREPLWPRRIPPNDEGVALGQAVVACMRTGGPHNHVPGRARKDHQCSG